MSITSQQIADKATSLIGTQGATCRAWFNTHVADFGTSTWAWCCAFTGYTLDQLGLPYAPYGWVGGWMSWAKTRNTWHPGTDGMRPGDLIIWDWNPSDLDADPDHISICTSFNGAVVESVGGNYGRSDKVVQQYADKNVSMVVGYIRLATQVPDPAPAPTPDPEPKPEPQPIADTYTVQAGDSIGQIIINQHWLQPGEDLWGPNGAVNRIAQANHISDPNLIHPGQTIHN